MPEANPASASMVSDLDGHVLTASSTFVRFARLQDKFLLEANSSFVVPRLADAINGPIGDWLSSQPPAVAACAGDALSSVDFRIPNIPASIDTCSLPRALFGAALAALQLGDFTAALAACDAVIDPISHDITASLAAAAGVLPEGMAIPAYLTRDTVTTADVAPLRPCDAHCSALEAALTAASGSPLCLPPFQSGAGQASKQRPDLSSGPAQQQSEALLPLTPLSASPNAGDDIPTRLPTAAETSSTLRHAAATSHRSFRSVWNRFGSRPTISAPATVATALALKALVLAHMGRPQDCQPALADALLLFPDAFTVAFLAGLTHEAIARMLSAEDGSCICADHSRASPTCRRGTCPRAACDIYSQSSSQSNQAGELLASEHEATSVRAAALLSAGRAFSTSARRLREQCRLANPAMGPERDLYHALLRRGILRRSEAGALFEAAQAAAEAAQSAALASLGVAAVAEFTALALVLARITGETYGTDEPALLEVSVLEHCGRCLREFGAATLAADCYRAASTTLAAATADSAFSDPGASKTSGQDGDVFSRMSHVTALLTTSVHLASLPPHDDVISSEELEHMSQTLVGMFLRPLKGAESGLLSTTDAQIAVFLHSHNTKPLFRHLRQSSALAARAVLIPALPLRSALCVCYPAGFSALETGSAVCCPSNSKNADVVTNLVLAAHSAGIKAGPATLTGRPVVLLKRKDAELYPVKPPSTLEVVSLLLAALTAARNLQRVDPHVVLTLRAWEHPHAREVAAFVAASNRELEELHILIGRRDTLAAVGIPRRSLAQHIPLLKLFGVMSATAPF
jgi:hypothetical protein